MGDGDMAAIRAAKKELRKSIRLTLNALSPESIREQSQNAAHTLFQMKEYQVATSVSVYLSMPSAELATTDIVHDAMHRGKRVFVPYIHTPAKPKRDQPSSILEMLTLKSLDEYNSLQPDKWGIPSLPKEGLIERENCFGGKGPEPDESQRGEGLDVIVVPGMAFDEQFGRLGHGKGYYDQLLARFSENPQAEMPFLVALAFEEQFLSHTIPTDENDWRMDAVITGDGKIRRRSKD